MCGGKNIIDHTNEQQRVLEQSNQEIAERKVSFCLLLHCTTNEPTTRGILSLFPSTAAFKGREGHRCPMIRDIYCEWPNGIVLSCCIMTLLKLYTPVLGRSDSFVCEVLVWAPYVVRNYL